MVLDGSFMSRVRCRTLVGALCAQGVLTNCHGSRAGGGMGAPMAFSLGILAVMICESLFPWGVSVSLKKDPPLPCPGV